MENILKFNPENGKKIRFSIFRLFNFPEKEKPN